MDQAREASEDRPRLASGDGLLVVDVQRDFLPGGALAVPGGDEIVPVVNRCVRLFRERGLPIFASRDWHPPNHCSFATAGGPWPPHCVANTPGAAPPEELELPEDTTIVRKGTRPDREAYSAFSETHLAERLRKQGVRRLFVAGLATDYCVRATVLDALREGFEVWLLIDAVRAVDVHPGDGERALEEMAAAGARLIRTDELQ